MASADKARKQQAKEHAKKHADATQTYLNISEIKDGVVVLKDGSIRAVLMTSAVNFALKSGAEQDSMIYSYQRFLNALTFPVQILVQSRKLDLEYYIDKLEKRAEDQEVELIKLQILEYSEFIKRLINVTNIMDKRFFVVVPFYPAGTEQVKGLRKLFATKPSQVENEKKAEEDFQRHKVQLMQRVEAIASGLGSIGLRGVTLNSEELVELLYNIYNPSTSTKERLMNVDELTAASIHRGGITAGGPEPAQGRASGATDEGPASDEPAAPQGQIEALDNAVDSNDEAVEAQRATEEA